MTPTNKGGPSKQQQKRPEGHWKGRPLVLSPATTGLQTFSTPGLATFASFFNPDFSKVLCYFYTPKKRKLQRKLFELLKNRVRTVGHVFFFKSCRRLPYYVQRFKLAIIWHQNIWGKSASLNTYFGFFTSNFFTNCSFFGTGCFAIWGQKYFNLSFWNVKYWIQDLKF